MEDIARLLLRRDARLCGQIAGTEDVDFAVVEYGCGVAKDEVHTALNIGIQKILAAEVGEQGVRIPEKTATLAISTLVPYLPSSGDEGKYIPYRDASVLMRWMILGSELDSRALGTSVAIPMLEKYCSNPGGL